MTFKDPTKGKDGLVFVTKKFDSNHTDLASMCEWIYTTLPDLEDRAIDVYMESTGKYSTPVFDVCEEMGLKPHIVNPKHVRTIAGQKTDQKDCAWIAELGANGLLRESYIPVRELRESRRLSLSRTVALDLRSESVNSFIRIFKLEFLDGGELCTSECFAKFFFFFGQNWKRRILSKACVDSMCSERSEAPIFQGEV